MTNYTSILDVASSKGFPVFPNSHLGWSEIPENATHLRFENLNGPAIWKEISDPAIERVETGSRKYNPYFYSMVEETWNQGRRIHYCTGWACAPGWVEETRPDCSDDSEMSVDNFLAL